MAAIAEPLVEIRRERSVFAIIGEALRLYIRMPLLFLALAAIIVVPVDLAQYAAAPDAVLGNDTSRAWLFVILFSSFFIAPPLIAAMYANVVSELGEGRKPRVASTLYRSLKVVPAVIATICFALLPALALAAAAGGPGSILCLLVSGVYLSGFLCVEACTVAVERVGPIAALRRYRTLIEGSLWRALGLFVLTGLLAVVATEIPLFALAGGSHEAVIVAAIIASDIVFMSATALVATMLYFDLRTRADTPF